MDSTVKPEPTGAHDVLLVRGDDNPTSDYEKVVREELARVQERLAKLASARAPEPAKAEIATEALNPKIEALDPTITTFRAAAAGNIDATGERRSFSRAAMSGATALLMAIGAAGAAVAWQSPYADPSKAMIAHWAPQLASILSLPLDKAAPPAESSSPAVQTAAADTGSSQAPAPNPPQDAAPAAATTTAATTTRQDAAPAAVSTAPAAPQPDVPQLLQSMAHDLASLEQGMEQLKASQEQLRRDNAKLAEQLKVGQEQMARVMAREQNLRPRPAPRPQTHRPVATLPPPRAIAPTGTTAMPPPPVQLQAAEPDLATAPRPPRAVP